MHARRSGVVTGLIVSLCAAAPALAGPGEAIPEYLEREPPVPGLTVESNHISKIIFLNRCAGGCTVYPGPNDARTDQSSIVDAESHIAEFIHGDAVWDEVVQCVKEIYAPYDVEITDVDPGENIFHHEAIVAGTWEDIDYDYPVGGVAPSICSPNNNVISFTFANGFPADGIRICEVIGQESAHSFGLEHAYDCSDPMTYLPRCGRQFFRDRVTPCGEFTEEECWCGGEAQNSHKWLLSVLGANETPVPGPEIEVLSPNPDAEVADGFQVAARALDMRGVGRVDLYLNGTRYDQVDGHSYDKATDPYRLDSPADLADGIIDIEIRARNDIGSETTASLTVTKGAPCTAASDCNPGQECDAGRCFFPPPTGELGDPCTADAECVSGLCPTENGQGYCSETCFPTTTGPTCPDGYDCVEVAPNQGVCWPAATDPGGCGCTNTGGQRWPGPFLLAAAVLLTLLRRRPAGR